MDVRQQAMQLLASGVDPRFGEACLPSTIATLTRCQRHEAWEALWGLLGDGLVYLDTAGQHSGTDNWRWRLSSTGHQAAAGGPWEPRDPDGYLRRLRSEVPDLDPLALRYVEEALRAFNARSYLATSVMLGVASEQVFLGLAAAYVQASGTTATRLRQLLASPRASYFVRFTEFRRLVEHQRGDLPADLSDVLTLDAVADLLRVTRNAAGHPSDELVDEDTARTHLHMAGRYLRKMTALRQHFAQRPEPVETP